MEADLLHFLPPAGWVFCFEHVRGSGGRELPPVSSRAGEGGEGAKGGQASKENRREAEK